MTGPVLRVDPTVLQDAGARFGEAGDGFAGMASGQSLDAAAAGVSQLATAAACRSAQQSISAEMRAAADGARQFGASLSAGADQYLRQDQAASSAVEGVQI
ncbi:hypothetical protein TUM20983_00840 [Mycobacterium antarcticum]|nr:hypothetical protein TUM20983_00840 [Mycolicibacterium sp. TUM20983]